MTKPYQGNHPIYMLHRLLVLLRDDPMSCPEIRRATGWPCLTVRAWVKQMVELQMLVALPVTLSEGRNTPRTRFRLAPQWMGELPPLPASGANG